MSRDAARWTELVFPDSAILVSPDQPVSIIRRDGVPDELGSWPDLDVGARTPSLTVMRGTTGAWALYRPISGDADDDPRLPEGRSSAVHIARDGVLTRHEGLDLHNVIGATRHGLWLADRIPNVASEWLARTDVQVLGPEGGRRAVALQQYPAFAIDDGRAARLVLFADPPEAVRAAWGGTRFRHSYAQIDLSAGDLPPAIDETATLQPFDENSLMALVAPLMPRELHGGPPDPGVRWHPVELSVADREAAVAAVVREFADIEGDEREGGVAPLARGLADSTVVAVGDWPATRVEVTFRHDVFPAGRLRRTLRVFDDAGRVSPSIYAAVHLSEDLATVDPSSLGSGREGILDF